VVHVFDDGVDVTTYLVTGDPPVFAGLDHETVAVALPATA
jgi:hypothetical protein